MVSNQWLERRRPHWERLAELVERSSRLGVTSLTRSELRDLGLLYRQGAADLSILRQEKGEAQFARYLNQLLGRAHNIIYTGRKSSWVNLGRFYRFRYPAVFRHLLPYTAAAAMLFVGGALTGAALTLTRPEFMHRLLGPAMIETIERREMWTHSIVGIKPLASSVILTNNVSVAFSAFAAGITGGVGSVYLMAFNGMLLGVVGAACWISGMSLKLWSFVLPHGVLELPAIMIAGAAGLRIASGLLFPGIYERRDALLQAGREAVELVLGTLPMLIVAAVIEAFFSPSALEPRWKFLFAAALLSLLAAWLVPRGLLRGAHAAFPADRLGEPRQASQS